MPVRSCRHDEFAGAHLRWLKGVQNGIDTLTGAITSVDSKEQIDDISEENHAQYPIREIEILPCSNINERRHDLTVSVQRPKSCCGSCRRVCLCTNLTTSSMASEIDSFT